MTPRVNRPQVLVYVAVVLAVSGCGEEPAWLPGGAAAGGASSRDIQGAGAALWGASVEPLGDGLVAVAVTDEDELQVVDLNTSQVRRHIRFPTGSKPTRFAVTKDGAFAVVLRGSGQLAVVQPGGDSRRYEACGEPRGVTFDEARGLVRAACADGKLVTVGPEGARAVEVGEELRDVFAFDGRVWATAFRTAELLELDDEGQVVGRLKPCRQTVTLPDGRGQSRTLTFTPRAALRAVLQGTRVVMVHQQHLDDEVSALTVRPDAPPTPPPYYGLGPRCGDAVVGSAVTAFDLQKGAVEWTALVSGAVPLDVAVDDASLSLVMTGSGGVSSTPWAGVRAGVCLSAVPQVVTPTPVGVGLVEGTPVVVDANGTLVTPGRPVVALRSRPTSDAARDFFHRQSPSGVACASCHVEGYDDGHTWNFQGRLVRTQVLGGGLSRTAPFHWRGEFSSLQSVLHNTFELRMGGTLAPDFSARDLGDWLDALPARRGRTADVSAGRAIFQSAGCATCHSGPSFTSNGTVDVGTGGAFQVPSLRGLKARGPWMHNGCAEKLEQRFDAACGGSKHGTVSAAEVPDLVKYLESL
ncbi:MAG: hypothetical protein IT380_20380 [Myxococcales bacterium]|nr:hypothetical protein [Myxococcales bacterium]